MCWSTRIFERALQTTNAFVTQPEGGQHVGCDWMYGDAASIQALLQPMQATLE